MKLSELILHVGDENVQIQNIEESCLGAKMIRGGTKLTIGTNAVSPKDILFPKQAKMRGIIVWMPVEKLPENLR